MGVIKALSNIKFVHPNYVILILMGKFYFAYGKDSYILSYIFGYKLNRIESEKTYSCAFPTNSIKKVTAKLEMQKINYILLDRRNNYEVDEKSDNKNLNTYEETFLKAKEYVNIKLRIDNIYKYFLQNLKSKEIKDKIKKVENILSEK